MTKKAEHEARVAEARRQAYLKKVRTLIGFAGERVTYAQAIAQMYTDVPAEKFAAEIASREPVGRAVFPVKLDAVKDANDWARKRVAHLVAQLTAANWDLNVVAPKGNAMKDSRYDYRAKSQLRAEYSWITRTRKGGAYRTGWEKEHFVDLDPERVEKFVADAERDAADVYDAFVCKLVAKIGPCDDASLEGSHVWSRSTLTVRKGSTTERWMTQQITNVSVLGKYFPQWPTRLLK